MPAAKPDVRHQIGQLGQQHERHRDAHDDRPAAALVDHQRRQPTAQAVRPGRDHEEEAEHQREEQHASPGPPSEHQSDRQAQHRRQNQGQAEAEVRREVVQQKHVRNETGRISRRLRSSISDRCNSMTSPDRPKDEKQHDQAVPHRPY